MFPCLRIRLCCCRRLYCITPLVSTRSWSSSGSSSGSCSGSSPGPAGSSSGSSRGSSGPSGSSPGPSPGPSSGSSSPSPVSSSGSSHVSSSGSSLEKVSRIVKSFIKSESIALTKTLTQCSASPALDSSHPGFDSSHPPSISSLDPQIRHALAKSIDGNARLLTLLSYPIPDIPADLYWHFYSLLDRPPTPSLRTLLIKRLIYHHCFIQCWDLCLNSHPQLNDIEEFIDLSLHHLRHSNNSTFGIFAFISASQHMASTFQLQNHILETFCFKLNKPRSWLDRGLQLQQQVNDMDSVINITQISSSLHHDPLLLAICIKRIVLLSGNPPVSPFHLASLSPSLLASISSFPGWVSFIFPNTYFGVRGFHTDLGPLFNSHPVVLNDSDAHSLLMSDSNVNLVAIFISHLKSMDSPRNPSPGIANKILSRLLDAQDFEQSKFIVLRAFKCLHQDLLVRFLVTCFSISSLDFKQISQKLARRNDFPNILHLVVSNIPHPLSPKQLELFMYLATKCPNPRKFMKSTLRPHFQLSNTPPNKTRFRSLFARLLAARRMRKPSILGEIALLMLRDSQIIDPKLLARLLDSLLKSPFEYDSGAHPNTQPRSFLCHHDIQQLLGKASYSQRAQFHNNLRQLGLVIASLNAHQISQTLNHLHSYIMSSEFTFITSKYGKSYIANCMTDEIVKFIILLNPLHLGLVELQSVKNGLAAPNNRLSHWLVKFTIQNNPQIAFQMLESRQGHNLVSPLNHHMKFILLGILHSPHLDANAKIDTFRKFVAIANNLGLNVPIGQMILYNIVCLLKQSRLTNQSLSPDKKLWIVQLLKDQSSIQRVAHICNWNER